MTEGHGILLRLLVQLCWFFNRLKLDTLPGYREAYEKLYLLYKRKLDGGLMVLTKAQFQLFSEGHLVDIGANIGSSSRVLAEALSEGFSVLAIEPESKNFHSLRKNFLNSSNVRCFNVAIGNSEGKASLAVSPFHRGDHYLSSNNPIPDAPNSSLVAVHTFDTFLRLNGVRACDVSFVKIDVQGGETNVIKGMSAFLRGNLKVALYIEVSNPSLSRSGTSVEELMNSLFDLGFCRTETLDHSGNLIALSRESILGSKKSFDLLVRSNAA
jgi:FkbM family methyltransferase